MQSPQDNYEVPGQQTPWDRRPKKKAAKLVALGATGLMVGAITLGLGNGASAEQPSADEAAGQETKVVSVVATRSGEALDGYEPSAEDEALFDKFDECLANAGIDLENNVFVYEGDITDTEMDALDAAFDTCDPILEDLSEEAFVIDDLSSEDEAVFKEFDQCLSDAGISFEADGDHNEAIELDLSDEQFDAAFEKCDPILENLSEGSSWAIEGDFEISPEDEAVFEKFDQCLTDAGVNIDVDEDEIDGADTEALDVAFETCEAVLDDLSEDADWMIEGDFDGELELSPEDEALFDKFDDCLTDAGIDFGEDGDEAIEFEITEEQMDALDAAFDKCDPILEELSEGSGVYFFEGDDLDAHIEAEHGEAVRVDAVRVDA